MSEIVKAEVTPSLMERRLKKTGQLATYEALLDEYNGDQVTLDTDLVIVRQEVERQHGAERADFA